MTDERNMYAVGIALVLLALLLRVGAVLATPDYLPRHDDRDYDRLGCWVAEHGFLPAHEPPWPRRSSCAPDLRRARDRSELATAYRPPLWPLTLGVTYAVSGRVGLGRWTAGRIVQALIGAAIAGLTGAIAAEVWGAATGLVALALTALFLPLVLDGATLISEPLMVALELGAVLAALRQRSRAGVRWALAAGALAGLAWLTRSSGAVLIPLLMALVWTPLRLRGAAAPAALALAAILVVAPWTVRNAIVLDAFVPVSTETGQTLLGTYNSFAATSHRCPGCWTLITRHRRFRGLVARLHALGEVGRDRLARTLAIDYAQAHPAYVAEVMWRNSVRLAELSGARRTRAAARTIDGSPRAAILGAWELWAVMLLAAIGLASRAARRAPVALLALPALLWLATLPIQSETPRFRAPLDPFLLMVAALGVAAGFARAGKRT